MLFGKYSDGPIWANDKNINGDFVILEEGSSLPSDSNYDFSLDIKASNHDGYYIYDLIGDLN